MHKKIIIAILALILLASGCLSSDKSPDEAAKETDAGNRTSLSGNGELSSTTANSSPDNQFVNESENSEQVLQQYQIVVPPHTATLNVGPDEEYKTIQSAVDAASNGDIINVASGTYPENVNIENNSNITILGTNYPKVDGFFFNGGGGTINGFSLQKDGISTDYVGDGLFRNNYFYNCGIRLLGAKGYINIINDQVMNGTIYLYDTTAVNMTGTTISNSKYGLYIGDLSWTPMVTKNTFKNCDTAIYFYGCDQDPRPLPEFSGNTYTGNKLNFGWGYKEYV